MPRTMWKGAISFGLVSIPVKVYPATEEKTLRFNQLHDEDHGRIKYQRTCAKCGEQVEYEHIVRGYEYEKDRYVILTDEDLDQVPVESGRAIDIEQFVDVEEIDPIYYKKSYYLAPEETGLKAYHLLREALAEDGRVGIAKVSFRDKEHLSVVRLRDNALVLETMYWPDEIRATDFEELDKPVKVRPQEVQMARSLIDNLTESWEPERYKDEYREALVGIVEKKVAGEEIEVIASPEEAPKVVDLMEALKQSVENTKKKEKKTTAASKKKAPAGKKKAS
ncbi:MAG TPA: Ku protein [Actinomycetota bacterium]